MRTIVRFAELINVCVLFSQNNKKVYDLLPQKEFIQIFHFISQNGDVFLSNTYCNIRIEIFVTLCMNFQEMNDEEQREVLSEIAYSK